ncbi:MAG: cadherin-like beta sandwich domain-containing protein [Bacteroidota bacterium]
MTAKPLTITGITINNKVYDATTSATIAGTAALSGVETGDVANVTLGGTGAAVFTTAVVGTAKAVTVSGYSISGGASANYSLTQPTGLTANITKISITVTATGPSTKAYGTALSASTGGTNFSTTGTLASGENLTSVTLTPNAAGLSATTAAGASYVVTPSAATGTGGFQESNYDVTYTAYNGTVTKAALTITATGPSTKAYGTALAVTTGGANFTAGATQNSETVTSVTLTPDAAGLSATTAATLGYVVTPSAATGTGGFLESNYNVTYTPYNGTVTKPNVTVTATGPSKGFGQTLSAGTSTTNFSVSGTLSSGEALTSVTLTPDAAGISAATAAGQGFVVTPSAATGTGGFLASNYNITYTPFNGIVGQIAITVTATGPGKTYGTALTAATSTTNFTVTGTLNTGESLTGVTLTPNAAGLSASTAAGAAYVITPSLATGTGGFDAANYTITYVPYNANVTKAALTVTATGPSKTYGTALSAGTSATNFTSGAAQNSETVTGITLTPNAAGIATATAAGAAYVVTPSLATGTGGFLESNYTITYVPFNGTVAKASITITATGPAKTYGTVLAAAASTSNFTSGATQNSESVTGVTLTPNAAGISGTTAVGAGYVSTPSAATGTGGFLESNYNVTYTPFNGTVTTTPLTITASNRTKFVGTTMVMGTSEFTSTGLKNSETVGGVTLTSGGSVSGAAINTYPIVASAATGGTFTASNYAISYVDGTLSVTNSTNANLSNLTLSGVTLSPVFAAGTLTYTGTVPNLTTSLTTTATVEDNTATITVNGTAATSATATAAIPLVVGTNTISVVVTAQNGTSTKTYQVTVTRAASAIADLSAYVISSGTLSPAFISATTSYADTVANNVTSITITPTASQANATIKVGGNLGATVASGAASASIALVLGENTIETVVTAQDGTTTKTYTTKVFRRGIPTINASSTSLTLSSVVAIPSSGATSVDISALDLVSPITAGVSAPYEISKNGTSAWTTSLTFAATDFPTTTTTQKVFVRITPTASGSVAASNLTLSTTAGTSKLVALNGTGIAANSDNANLSSLKSPDYTISPTFTEAVLNYTASVANNITSVAIVPQTAQANATIKVNNVTVASGSVTNQQLIVGANTITFEVKAQDLVAIKKYIIVITRAAAVLATNEVAPDANGNATVTAAKPEVKVTNPTQPVTVSVPAGTTNAAVDYGTLVTVTAGTSTAVLPKTTINSDVSKIEIPPATTIKASNASWDGSLLAPTITSYDIPVTIGLDKVANLIIELGHPTISFSLDKAVRLLLPGQAGKSAALVHNGVYKEISRVGATDTQFEGDLLPAEEAYKIDVGADLVIWTKAFSTFITFTQTVDLNVAVVAADAAGLTADAIRGNNADLSNITTSLVSPLPSAGAGGSTITWASSNPAVVSANGQTITRPVQGSASPTVTLTATIKKGLIVQTKPFTLTVLPLANQAPTLAAISNQTICFTTAPQNITLTGITAGPESGQTTTLSVTSSNPGLLTGLAVNSTTGVLTYTPSSTAGGVATITVTARDNGGTVGSGVDSFVRTFTVTVNPLPTVAIFNSLGTNDVSKGLTAILTATGGTSYIWSNASGIIGGQNTAALTVRPTVTTTYTVTVTNANGCASIQIITLNVVEDYKALDINNLMSPNGDGVNDALVIKNLDMYPNNTVKVFDRAGRILYQKQNYTNDWAGTFQGSPLSEGTYFYVVDFGTGKKVLKGFVSIVN